MKTGYMINKTKAYCFEIDCNDFQSPSVASIAKTGSASMNMNVESNMLQLFCQKV